MNVLKELTGQRFGSWTVRWRGHNGKAGATRWMCECACGKERLVSSFALRRGRSSSCRSCAQAGPKSSRWRGGRSTIKSGYVRICDPRHPNAGKSGAVYEHVKVLAEALGRPLAIHEQVHHLNKIRGDNRIENLELWTTSQPSGARVSDLIEWAEWLLAQYNPAALAPPVTPVFGQLRRTSP